MASDDKWTVVSAALRGELTRAPRVDGRRRAESATVKGRARARRALPSIDEIRALRSPIDLTRDDGTEGARAFRAIQARMAEQLVVSSEDDAYLFRGGEFVLT